MFQTVLLIQLLLVHYATQNPVNIQAACKENVTLKCSDNIDDKNFISVTWYKFINTKKNGIIRRDSDETSTEPTKRYNFTRHAELGEKYSLFLSSVTPEDSGTYECLISAKVGGQNRNLQIELMVNDTACMTQPEPTMRTNALNTTQEPDLCPHVKDLPVMWSIIGYLAVGLAKISLSLISIWVIQAIRVRSSRQDEHKW